jgi:hypothetical protein
MSVSVPCATHQLFSLQADQLMSWMMSEGCPDLVQQDTPLYASVIQADTRVYAHITNMMVKSHTALMYAVHNELHAIHLVSRIRLISVYYIAQTLIDCAELSLKLLT